MGTLTVSHNDSKKITELLHHLFISKKMTKNATFINNKGIKVTEFIYNDDFYDEVILKCIDEDIEML